MATCDPKVKEEILTRLVELGVFVNDGQISFDPILLRKDEFTSKPAVFEYFDLAGEVQRVELPAGCLVFTICQTPVIYQTSGGDEQGHFILVPEDGQIIFGNGETGKIPTPGARLDRETSRHIFQRDGVISKIVLSLKTQKSIPDDVRRTTL